MQPSTALQCACPIRAALYCRLSKDDERAGESVSIETQKMILTEFCHAHHFNIYDIYCDDGFSGLNFNRPGFRKMLHDIDAGSIDVVITKDLSRLGRDYIMTGYYTDVYFPKKHVRYIAVNDDIDTKKDSNDIAPFKNILNDMYAHDISKKIKSAKRQRALKGLYISSQAPYGYKPNPENHNALVVDEDAAKHVRQIFQMAEHGMSITDIANTMTKRRILCPAAYKTINGDARFARYCRNTDEYQWKKETVRKMLRDRMYCGDMVNHKHEVISYKTKERVAVPESQYIIVSGTHEAIISESQFSRVQQQLQKRALSPRYRLEDPIKGYLFCAECGGKLSVAVKNKNTNPRLIMRCMQHYAKPQVCAHPHAAPFDYISQEANRQVKEYLLSIPSEKWQAEVCNTEGIRQRQMDLDIERQRLKKRLAAIDAAQQRKDTSYQFQLLELEKKEQQLQMEVQDSVQSLLQRVENMQSIPYAIAQALIAKIEVGYRGQCEENIVPITVRFRNLQEQRSDHSYHPFASCREDDSLIMLVQSISDIRNRNP